MKKKNIDYYMNLPYNIIIRKDPLGHLTKIIYQHVVDIFISVMADHLCETL